LRFEYFLIIYSSINITPPFIYSLRNALQYKYNTVRYICQPPVKTVSSIEYIVSSKERKRKDKKIRFLLLL